jgi:hypothetical protein
MNDGSISYTELKTEVLRKFTIAAIPWLDPAIEIVLQGYNQDIINPRDEKILRKRTLWLR